MIRILVADDHPVVRHGVRQIAGTTPDLTVAAEAGNGDEVVDRSRTTEHDLVLLDFSMPDTNALELLKQLKRERPKTPVLILTLHTEDQFAIRALKAGASGYLLKDSTPDEIIAAVRRVVAGGRYVSPRVAEKLAGHIADAADMPPHDRLSDREYEVLRMIAAGKTTREIAGELTLSIKTIGTYRARIFEKMRMKTTAQLAAYVVRNHLAD